VTHPRLEYLLVACLAAAVTYLLTPVARRVAIRIKAVAKPRDRDVHAVAIPRMGGVAIFAGLALGLFVASRLPSLHESFENGPVMSWVVAAAAIICAVGVIDDRVELDSLTKLCGQVLATGIMVIKGGVQIGTIGFPGQSIVLGPDLAIPITILLSVLTINAMNFIDGLDGLAAGVSLISAVAVFVYSYHLAGGGFSGVTAPPALLAAVLAGACAGFLPHNFFPARVFMGDSGSMVVGLLLAAATTTATTSTDPATLQSFGAVPLFLPLLIPLAVLALPFVDLLLAVVRRVSKRRSPFSPDKKHLHHRLLELGHSHRRAVLLLYFWSALVACAGVGLTYGHDPWLVLTVIIAFAVLGVAVSLVPTLRGRFRRPRPGGPAQV
jgi:UDP-GlcNAc:undecaprenyl-phosphate/decaprenyl-phosphate GlcNAc-1-phosphate transferase